MNFTNQYLTYSEYRELGGTLDEVPFNELEFECRRIIDERTQNRLHFIDIIPNEVKMCTYKMINEIERCNLEKEKAQNGIKSENIDGYSVTYMDSNEIQQLITTKITDLKELVSTYLFGVVVNNEHILYCGVK